MYLMADEFDEPRDDVTCDSLVQVTSMKFFKCIWTAVFDDVSEWVLDVSNMLIKLCYQRVICVSDIDKISDKSFLSDGA